jgi:hypothetical protein
MIPEFSFAEFGAIWQKFMEHVNAHAPAQNSTTPPLADKIQAFLEADPTPMVILQETFLERDLPNLQLAFQHFLTGPERLADLLGYTVEHDHPNFGLSMILSMRRWQVVTEGPVQYTSVELADGERLQCVQKGLYFIRDHGYKAVAFIRSGDQHWGLPGLKLEVMCPDAERAEAILAELRRLVSEHNVYRGHVISLGAKGPEDVRFHALPAIERDSIILPPRLLETIERNTLGFTEHAERLRAAGRHIKRGLLFHGPPGTGKTLTVMYLASQMRAQASGRTVILLTGRVQGLIVQSCRLARLLAPSMVVLEDVDLVAEERDHEGEGGPLLFELLNEMDGLAPDTDVLFILSTNRPDLLERALTARPGRIDQAIEFPLPDADCRRRLFALYGRGLNLDVRDLDDMIRRTEGVSSAFIRELLRKAALTVADQSRDTTQPPTVTDAHLREALQAIVAEGGELTKRLLGVAPGALG